MATYAYIDYWGVRADGHRVRSIVPQLDGSSMQGSNCAPSCEAARDIRSRLGIRPSIGAPWPPSGQSIRLGSSDRTEGMTPYQTAAVSKRVYGIGSDIRIVAWTTLYEWLRKGGGFTLLVNYRAIAVAGMSGSPGFYGNHSIPIVGIAGTSSAIQLADGDPLYDGRRLGIREGLQWLPIKVAQKAAAELSLSPGVSLGSKYPGKAMVSFDTRVFTPPPPSTAVKLYPGATKLQKPRIYTPTRSLWMRKTPRMVGTNHITTVSPGFRFEAYQYIINGDGKWVGNKTGTAWLRFDSIKFVRYI